MSFRVIIAEDGTPRGIKEAKGNASPPGWSVQTVYTHAEVLALMERVREACARVVDGCAVDESPSAPNYLDDVADMLRAVDVARLLDSGD